MRIRSVAEGSLAYFKRRSKPAFAELRMHDGVHGARSVQCVLRPRPRSPCRLGKTTLCGKAVPFPEGASPRSDKTPGMASAYDCRGENSAGPERSQRAS